MSDEIFSWGWKIWLAFLILLEGIALLRKAEGDTLSEHVWAWLKGKPGRYILLGAFLAWLFIHFMWGGRLG